MVVCCSPTDDRRRLPRPLFTRRAGRCVAFDRCILVERRRWQGPLAVKAPLRGATSCWIRRYRSGRRSSPRSRSSRSPCVDHPPSANFPRLISGRPFSRSASTVRDQGGRGTCSVFTLTFLLEYWYFTRLTTGSNNLSEEYLNYVANLVSGNTADGDFFDHPRRGLPELGHRPRDERALSGNGGDDDSPGRCSTPAACGRGSRQISSRCGTARRVRRNRRSIAPSRISTRTFPWPSADSGRPRRRGAPHLVGGIDVIKTVPPLSQKATAVFDGHSVPLVGYRKDSAFAGGG